MATLYQFMTQKTGELSPLIRLALAWQLAALASYSQDKLASKSLWHKVCTILYNQRQCSQS